jgi:hypothetical protein
MEIDKTRSSKKKNPDNPLTSAHRDTETRRCVSAAFDFSVTDET